MIRPTIIYTKLFHVIHMIQNLIQIIQQHKPVHFLWELYHANLLMEPVCRVTCLIHELIQVLLNHKPVHFLWESYHVTYLRNAVFQLPSTTIKCTIISSNRNTYRKLYAMQQLAQTSTTHTKWPWIRPKFIRLFLVRII